MSQQPPILIRSENPDDVAAIRAATEAAFTASEFGHHGEADLIDRLRSKCENLLSLVALNGDRVVGHVLFSPARIQEADIILEGMGLGPIAVLPEFQGRGIGTQLTRAGLALLGEHRTPFVCVLGDPMFYGRCGFQAAAPLGIYSEFGGDTDGSFQVAWLNESPHAFQRALARYRPEFSELAPLKGKNDA